jgi:DNA-directed RNA polymerase sigma subunit (sigma70/sigma32)
MSWALDEFYASVEEEFGVAIEDPEQLDTPGAVIDFLESATSPQDGMDEAEHREHIASIVGELMARTLGITRYREDWRFTDMR